MRYGLSPPPEAHDGKAGGIVTRRRIQIGIVEPKSRA